MKEGKYYKGPIKKLHVEWSYVCEHFSEQVSIVKYNTIFERSQNDGMIDIETGNFIPYENQARDILYNPMHSEFEKDTGNCNFCNLNDLERMSAEEVIIRILAKKNTK